MKYLKYLSMAMLAVLMLSCGSKHEGEKISKELPIDVYATKIDKVKGNDALKRIVSLSDSTSFTMACKDNKLEGTIDVKFRPYSYEFEGASVESVADMFKKADIKAYAFKDGQSYDANIFFTLSDSAITAIAKSIVEDTEGVMSFTYTSEDTDNFDTFAGADKAMIKVENPKALL